jgi:signal transduction histidine kinase
LESTQQALRETNALYHISRGLLALDAEELLHDAVDLLQKNFGFNLVQVYLLDPETGDFILKASSSDIGKKLKEADHRLKAGAGIIGHVAETREPFFTNDVNHVIFHIKNPIQLDTKSEMAVPILAGDQLLGVLDVQQAQTTNFTPRDLQLVGIVADQLAASLQKAELYETLQISLKQEKAVRNQLIQNERLAVMGRLLASVSHELNNPLQAIQNALFLLKEEKGMSAQGYNDLEIVIAESERMASLIERLRDTYRPPQAEDLQPTHLNSIIADVYALTATHLRKNNVTFEFQPDEELPVIMALSDQIRQVALNLLMNGVEAMQNGGKLTVRTQYLNETNEIMMSVCDTGMGISPAILPYIFDPFVTNKKRGTGIGLTISHDIVLKHRGRLIAENNVITSGATFKVWLPVAGIPAEIE